MGETFHDSAHRFAPAAPEEEYVYGACCPGWHSAGAHETCIDQWIEDVRAADIERVCCLLPGQKLDACGGNVSRYRDAFGEERVLHAPVPDHRLVDEELLDEEILPFLEAGVEADEPVVVHCLSGIGRTGQVLAAWLAAERDYRPQDAIDTVCEMGRDPREPIQSGNATKTELFDVLESVAKSW